MITAFLTESGISKENMAALLAGLTLPVQKPFKRVGEWSEYAKWFSVVCNEHPHTEGGQIGNLSLQDALALADKYKPELGYNMRLAMRERSVIYNDAKPEVAKPEKEVTKPVQQWRIKLDHERGGDVLRDWIIEVLKTYDTYAPKPSVSKVFEGLSDKLTRETARGPNYMKYIFDADGLGGVKFAGKEAIERRIRSLMVSN
jgi:hypothetical protein